MDSWVYLFSQFTPEALVLELALIFILSGGYAVYWILHKRRYGVVEKDLPAGPVKAYLGELIGSADQLRTQLFGLLSGGDKDAQNFSNSDLGKMLASLEAKLEDQRNAIAALSANGVKLAAGSSLPVMEEAPAVQQIMSSGPSGGGNEPEMASLRDKIDNLETRLAEYSIIEDDLANLKRIQQENAELRALLKAQKASGESASAAEAPPPPVASAPAPPPPVEEQPVPTAEAVSPPSASTQSDPPLPKVTESDSLNVPPPSKPADMGEDDLVKEFEKMLQG